MAINTDSKKVSKVGLSQYHDQLMQSVLTPIRRSSAPFTNTHMGITGQWEDNLLENNGLTWQVEKRTPAVGDPTKEIVQPCYMWNEDAQWL